MDLNPQAVAAILGGAAVGTFALGSQLVAIWGSHLARKHDARQRDAEWFRHQLLDTYSNCLHRLYCVVGFGDPSKPTDESLDRDLGECQRYLLLLAAYVSDPQSRGKLSAFSRDLTNNWDRGAIKHNALQAARKVQELLWADDRIQPKIAGPPKNLQT